MPGNSFITSILNTNLNIVNSNSNSSKNKITLSEQELLFQLKYEYHPEDAVKMKVSYNLGVLHYKYSEKYELSKQYLLKCI